MATRYLCPVFLAFAFWLPGAQAAVVPNVAGQTEAAATRTLANARLAVGSVTTSPCTPAGQVTSQSPAAGTSVNDGSWVDLVVCAGAATGPSPTPGTVRPPPTPPTPPATPPTTPPTTPPATPILFSKSFHISIKNDYITSLNFGVLGKGERDGIDTAEGVLEFDEGSDRYVGTVKASVYSTQTLAGLGGVGSCSGRFDASQELRVIGRRTTGGFNTQFQTVTPATIAARTTEYLVLEFRPKPGAELPPNPDPFQDEVTNCHTIIETPAGRFIPLNDTRWTMAGGGYIIALPSSGTINYTDTAVNPSVGGMTAGPFKVNESVWTIEVRRLR